MSYENDYSISDILNGTYQKDNDTIMLCNFLDAKSVASIFQTLNSTVNGTSSNPIGIAKEIVESIYGAKGILEKDIVSQRYKDETYKKYITDIYSDMEELQNLLSIQLASGLSDIITNYNKKLTEAKESFASSKLIPAIDEYNEYQLEKSKIENSDGTITYDDSFDMIEEYEKQRVGRDLELVVASHWNITHNPKLMPYDWTRSIWDDSCISIEATITNDSTTNLDFSSPLTNSEQSSTPSGQSSQGTETSSENVESSAVTTYTVTTGATYVIHSSPDRTPLAITKKGEDGQEVIYGYPHEYYAQYTEFYHPTYGIDIIDRETLPVFQGSSISTEPGYYWQEGTNKIIYVSKKEDGTVDWKYVNVYEQKGNEYTVPRYGEEISVKIKSNGEIYDQMEGGIYQPTTHSNVWESINNSENGECTITTGSTYTVSSSSEGAHPLSITRTEIDGTETTYEYPRHYGDGNTYLYHPTIGTVTLDISELPEFKGIQNCTESGYYWSDDMHSVAYVNTETTEVIWTSTYLKDDNMYTIPEFGQETRIIIDSDGKIKD